MNVHTQFYTYGETAQDRLSLQDGSSFGPITLAYETFGTLNESKSNAILLFHALSGSQHAAGNNAVVDAAGDRWTSECQTGWWDAFIGSGEILDTDNYFIICCNYFGGCYGSTGPSSINPATDKPYGGDFPHVQFSDIVDAQLPLFNHLGIDSFHTVIGSSLGGMMALNFSTRYPAKTKRVITIACGLRAPTLTKVHNLEQILSIENDPNFRNGNYYEGIEPRRGLALARMISHKTFVSLTDMEARMTNRCEQEKDEFSWYKIRRPLESYLLHQGRKFVCRFDANTYLNLIAAWSQFDLREDLNATSDQTLFQSCQHQKHLVFSIDSDCCFYPEEQQDLFQALQASEVPSTYHIISSEKGHDSFLLEPTLYQDQIKKLLRS
ncbi:MAG: homoserine O-acetyltransferase [Kiritimatiellaceae bacterium]|nr:homoserine O-acetyltransferase [Kiritimatiellaceae bacterium]